MSEIDKALAYLLQKPKLIRQTCDQNLSNFIKNGVPVCYEPDKYRRAIESLLPLTDDPIINIYETIQYTNSTISAE